MWIMVNQKKLFRTKKILEVCSIEESKSKSVIVDESSMEESELESVHKSINTNITYAIDKIYHEESLVTDNIVINDPSHSNPLKCGKSLLNRLAVTCERA